MNISQVNRSITLIERLFDPRHPTESFIPPTAGKPRWKHVDTHGEPYLDTAALVKVGVPLAAFSKYLLALRDTQGIDTHGVVLTKGGEVLARVNFGAHDMTVPRYVYSASKTVTAMAVGVLFDRGLLSPDDKITDIFSEQLSTVAKLRLSALTVEDLLTMRSAVTFSEGEAMTDGDWVKCFLSSSTSGDVGKTFHYNSLNTYILSAIVTKKTGMTLFAFAKETFFAPLGIVSAFWEGCPMGNTIGGWGLYIAPADLCKLGAVLIDGTYAGRRYLSEKFVTKMTSPVAQGLYENGAYDYGYQIWVNRGSGVSLMNGMFGQNVFIDGRSGIVMAVCSGNGEVFQQSATYPLTEKFLSALGGDSVSAVQEKEALSSLVFSLCEQKNVRPEKHEETQKKRGFFKTLLARLVDGEEVTERKGKEGGTQNENALPENALPFEEKTFVPTSDLCASLGLLPVILQAVRNHYTRGLSALSVGKERNGTLDITWAEGEDTHVFSVGLDGVSRRTWLTFGASPYLVDAKGAFVQNEDGEPVLRMEIIFAETPHARTVKLFARRDGTYTLCAEESPGEALIVREATALKRKAETQPIIGAVLSKIDDDYLAYRAQRTFATRVGMEIRKDRI